MSKKKKKKPSLPLFATSLTPPSLRLSSLHSEKTLGANKKNKKNEVTVGCHNEFQGFSFHFVKKKKRK